MKPKFTEGTQVPMRNGGIAEVEEWLAEGTQADIYRVRYQGQEKALKWFWPGGMGENFTDYYSYLVANAAKGPSDSYLAANVAKGPSESCFLWPQELSAKEGNDGFGYLMELLPDGYCRLSDFLLRKREVTFPSRSVAVEAALQAVSAFWALHDAGYRYGQLDGGSFFIHPQNGSVRAIGDGVLSVADSGQQLPAKPRYMAPEMIAGECSPDIYSDRYSMALILFILLFSGHPLEGKRALQPVLTPELQKELYVTKPLFVMDAKNQENAPDVTVHRQVLAAWQDMPQYLQELFLRVFGSQELKKRCGRPGETEWVEGLLRYRSGLVACRCGQEAFMGSRMGSRMRGMMEDKPGTFMENMEGQPEAFIEGIEGMEGKQEALMEGQPEAFTESRQDGLPEKCSHCGRVLTVPFWLELSGYRMPGTAGKKLYGWQIGKRGRQEALVPVGHVVASRADTGKLALKNIGKVAWGAWLQDGKPRWIGPGKFLPFMDGIHFMEKNGLESMQIIKNHSR